PPQHKPATKERTYVMTQLDDIRAQVQEVLDRAQADSAYFEQLKNDPQATLVAAGVPAEATPDLIAELAGEDEVSGYMRCDRYTCIFDITMSTCGCWTIGGTSYHTRTRRVDWSQCHRADTRSEHTTRNRRTVLVR